MTKVEAQKVLAGPLRFGDWRQIEAHEWLKLFVKINGSKAECSQCDGTGICECGHCSAEHECGHCHGTGDFCLSDRADFSLKQLRELDKEIEEAIRENQSAD